MKFAILRCKRGWTDSSTLIARSVTPSRDSIHWRRKRPQNPLLSLRELGFSDKDLDMQVSSKFFLDCKKMTLREMIAKLEAIYADTIGTEFMHIQNTRIRNWVRHRLESRPAKRDTPASVQIHLLRALLEAESFEAFLHARYVGQKRFSLQGAESLMVILDRILQKCPGRRH